MEHPHARILTGALALALGSGCGAKDAPEPGSTGDRASASAAPPETDTASAEPEGEPIEGLSVQERHDRVDIAFDGAVVTVHGRELSFSYTQGIEALDCGHRVVPVAHTYLRERPDTAYLHLRIEDRPATRATRDCEERSVTPRMLAIAPIPDGISQIRAVIEVTQVSATGAEPTQVRYERMVPVRDETHVLKPLP